MLSTMTPGMKDEVHVLAPRVAAWLRRIGAVETGKITPAVAAVPSPSADAEYPEFPDYLRRRLQ